MHIDAFLKPEAMPALLKIIDEHQLAELPEGKCMRGPGSKGGDHPRGPRRGGGGGPKEWMEEIPGLPFKLSDIAHAVRDQISKFTPKEMLEKSQPTTFSEKFVVIVGWLEAKRDRRPIRPEIQATFARWPLEPSGNPARDFRGAVNQGWIAKNGREIGLTETGWTKLGEMAGLGGNDDAVPA
jgi:hypothetical protein